MTRRKCFGTWSCFTNGTSINIYIHRHTEHNYWNEKRLVLGKSNTASCDVFLNSIPFLTLPFSFVSQDGSNFVMVLQGAGKPARSQPLFLLVLRLVHVFYIGRFIWKSFRSSFGEACLNSIPTGVCLCNWNRCGWQDGLMHTEAALF